MRSKRAWPSQSTSPKSVAKRRKTSTAFRRKGFRGSGQMRPASTNYESLTGPPSSKDFPSPGFDLSHRRRRRQRSESDSDMRAKAKAKGKAKKPGPVTVESWTKGTLRSAPMNSNFNGLRLDDSSEVDIVKCADGTSPLKANASNALIRAPGNRGKPKPSKNRKRKTADTAVDDIDERDAKSRKDDAAGKRKATNKVDERRAPPPPVASPRPSLSPPPFPQHLKFGRRCRRIWFRSWARNRYRRWSACE